MGRIGKSIYDEMTESWEDINLSELQKTEIREQARDWHDQKILKETSVVLGKNRSSVHKNSRRHLLLTNFADAVLTRKRLEKHKHKEAMHKEIAEIYRRALNRMKENFEFKGTEKEAEKLLDPERIVDREIQRMDLDRDLKKQIKVCEIDPPIEDAKIVIEKKSDGEWREA